MEKAKFKLNWWFKKISLFRLLIIFPFFLDHSYFPLNHYSSIRPEGLFWEVNLNLFLKGSYACQQDDRYFEGYYRGHFRWQGLIEPDDPDVILFPYQCERVSWEIIEKEKRKGQEIFSHQPSLAPELKVEAFILEGEAFWLDFFMESFPIPFSLPDPRQKLILPASYIKEQRINNLRYNDYLKVGSNKVFIPVKGLAQPEYRQTFFWKWSYPPHYPHLGTHELGTEHEVVVELVIKSRYQL